MNTDFRSWMDERRLRAIDVADALGTTVATVYSMRYHGIPEKWKAKVARYKRMYDEPRHDLADALMDAIKRVHEITSGVVVGK